MSTSINYRPMTAADIPAMVKLHVEAFSGYFMTLMGERFISMYYREYLDHPHAYTWLALDGDRLAGLIVGGRNIGDLERRFYRRNFLALGSIVAFKFVTNRAARANLVERRGVIRLAIREVLGRAFTRTRGAERPHAGGTDLVQASRLVVAVDEAYRGRGVGGALNARFVESARADGVHVLRSTVRRDNPSHAARLEKAGWQPIYTDDKKVLFTFDVSEPETTSP